MPRTKKSRRKNLNAPEKFEPGDRVQWQSQASGYTLRKTGVVLCVVMPNEPPTVAVSRNALTLDLRRAKGLVRNHRSYLVRVEERGVYWPRANKLRRVPGHTPVESLAPA
jgi:hypothetical protein